MYISTPRSNLVVRFLSVFLLCCSSLYASTDQTGKQKVTVVGTDVTLETVFRQIEKQTGLRFMYAVDAVDVKEKVTVMFEKVMLDDVLESLLGKKGIEWVYREGVISLKKLVSASNVSLPLGDEYSITIKGRVLDAKNNPVPGATVMVKGGKRGTKTDGEGAFFLSGVDSSATILITHIGFETREIAANSKVMNIRMKEVAGILDETVVVGYGVTTQRFNTGNVTSIKNEELMRNPVSDPLLALQGRVPGMIISQTTGLAGAAVKIQIRGQNSIRSGTAPLFIIDGVPYQPSVVSNTLGGYGALGGALSALNFINPGDIESLDVLKDADATAIYGSRGANGVILITTKKGKLGEPRVDVNFNTGWQSLGARRKLLNTSEYLKMRHEAFNNDGETPMPENAPDLLLWDTTRNTDWQKTLLGSTARYTDMQASISGGSGLIRYTIGGNYHKETTIFPGSFGSRRGGAHFNIVGEGSNQKFKSSITANYTTNQSNNPGTDFAASINLPPNAPALYKDGILNWENSTWVNPYAQLINNVYEGKTTNLVANIDLSYRFGTDLTLKANIGYNDLINNTFSALLIEGRPPKDRNNARATARYLNMKTISWISEPQITYHKSITRNTIDALLGVTLLGTKLNGSYSTTGGIMQDALVRFPAAATSYFIRGNSSYYKYIAFFGKLGYIYDDKYLVNLVVRRDGSSRFGPRNQFATFGSIGVGWIFSQENFIRDHVSILSHGKIRGSYGITGNDQVGDYEYLDRYDFVENIYQGQKGLRVTGLFNPDFKWEKTKKAEIAIEFGLLKDRVFLSVSKYNNRSSNQLLPYPLPIMAGNPTITGNLPVTIDNKGLEVILNTQNFKGKFEWFTSFNFSLVRNKVVSDDMQLLGRNRIGRSLSTIDIYQALGVNSSIGEYQFADAKGDPVAWTDADGFHAVVDLAPKFFGGFQNSIVFKNVQLDVLFQYVKQQGTDGLFDPSWLPGTIRNQTSDVLDRWQEKGDIASNQKFSQNGSLLDSYRIRLASTAGYRDASFIRCKNVMISWQIPNVKRRFHLQSCRIYAQGQNLFKISSYTGWDPETQSALVLPPLRVFTMGIQLSI